MSIGHGGAAHLFQADETHVLYTYCSYNQNVTGYKRFLATEDGELLLARDAFPEPEIRVKRKRTTSGRKKTIVRRIPRDVSVEALVAAGKISVRNASGTWRVTETGTDFMALKLINVAFHEYQLTGTIPSSVSVYY